MHIDEDYRTRMIRIELIHTDLFVLYQVGKPHVDFYHLGLALTSMEKEVSYSLEGG